MNKKEVQTASPFPRRNSFTLLRHGQYDSMSPEEREEIDRQIDENWKMYIVLPTATAEERRKRECRGNDQVLFVDPMNGDPALRRYQIRNQPGIYHLKDFKWEEVDIQPPRAQSPPHRPSLCLIL